jgi:ATP-dependent helicase/nuclease subunit A
MEWGRLVHRLLEARMRDPALETRAYAENLLRGEERDAKELEELLDLVAAVEASPLWRRALASPRRLVEVPFAVSVPSAELGLAAPPQETLLQGAIDLAFEEEGVWIVVDYKSDVVSGNLGQLVDFYRPQVDHYRRYWERLTGQKTKAGLYFLSSGEEVWLQ